jgi:hypothetical protein
MFREAEASQTARLSCAFLSEGHLNDLNHTRWCKFEIFQKTKKMENKVNVQVPDDVVVAAREKIEEAAVLLEPYLIALKPKERLRLPKMSDGTVPFVLKCLDYSISDPQFAPPFMDKEELAADMKVHEQLNSIFRPVKQLSDGLDDTVMQAGGESFVNALSYYHSIKQAAHMNVPGAKAIYEDLKVRFASNGNRKATEGVK